MSKGKIRRYTIMIKTIVAVTLTALWFLVGANVAVACTCTYKLTTAPDPTLPPNRRPTARATITKNPDTGDNHLIVRFRRARPHTLYTVWVDFRSREFGFPSDYPFAQGALARGVAPAFGTTTGVTSGMGLDENAIITNRRGNATLHVLLDYDLFEPGASPVVGRQLAVQGPNRVGGYWLRKYDLPAYDPVTGEPTKEASVQSTDARGLPELERSTAQGLTIVGHHDRISHGHTPGVGGTDHFPGFFGDFPADCPRPIPEDPDDPDEG
ncbi:MAG: hypothetical protein ACR2RL_27160 [Gammaproteobacteria bacterium]